MAKKKRRRKKRRRRAPGGAGTGGQAELVRGGATSEASGGAGVARAAPRAGPERPAAPWGSFPLSEIVVAIAIVLLIGGFVVPPPRGAVMLGAGLVLGSLAGLELSVREHFAGYKSHTLLLASAAGVAVIGGLFALGPDGVTPVLKIAAGIVAFGLAAWGLTSTFRRRSGGALFKTRA